ncbi:MAG: TMEM175 family protein, partial [Candidatus Dormiibacterota bacterium]
MQEEDERPGSPASSGNRPAAADGYGVGRLLALSDGVFAIAMTLLVLNIPVAVSGRTTNASAWAAFQNSFDALIGFGVSFIVVGIYWVTHHRALRSLAHADTGMLRRNLAVLLLVCVIPFATSFYMRFAGTLTGTEVYYGALLLMGVTSVVLLPHPPLVPPSLEGRTRLRAVLLALPDRLGAIPVFVIGMLVALWDPGLASWTWVLLAPQGLVERWANHRARAPTAAASTTA